jgi:hypothetical protein
MHACTKPMLNRSVTSSFNTSTMREREIEERERDVICHNPRKQARNAAIQASRNEQGGIRTQSYPPSLNPPARVEPRVVVHSTTNVGNDSPPAVKRRFVAELKPVNVGIQMIPPHNSYFRSVAHKGSTATIFRFEPKRLELVLGKTPQLFTAPQSNPQSSKLNSIITQKKHTRDSG